MITHAELLEILSYSPETGLFVWRKSGAAGVQKAGRIAGSDHHQKSGYSYRRIQIRYQQYQAHRLAYFYMTGEWPPFHIDHADGNGLNNKWSNIRAATYSQNAANAGMYSTNTSGFKGVTWNKKCQRWQAQIKKHGKNLYLGLFDTPEAAHKAYASAARHQFGQFARAA